MKLVGPNKPTTPVIGATKPVVKPTGPTVKTTPSPVPSGKSWPERHRSSAKK